MAAYKTKWNLQPVVKFDTWVSDPDIVTEWINYITVGLNYYINDYSRIQINYVNVTEGLPVDNDMIMLQLQAKF